MRVQVAEASSGGGSDGPVAHLPTVGIYKNKMQGKGGGADASHPEDSTGMARHGGSVILYN